MINKLAFPFIVSALLFYISPALSQKITISGYITDGSSGEKMIGATVYEPNQKVGTTSNTYGFYSLTLNAADSVILQFRYIGYTTQVLSFQKPQKDVHLNISLKSSIDLKAIEVVETREVKIEEKSQMSVIEIPVSQIKSIPALLGEVDVLKALQLLPGVQSGGEGGSGLYVRGGGPDQNLILLDGAPVYNATHLFGFFSVFNADAIKNVQLTKGGFPARYGGRLSSVIEINMKDGNMKKFQGEGSIGLIASRLTLEGPIWKDRTSFIISGRRTYIDLLSRPFMTPEITFGYYFYDLNAKINHKLSEKDHLYLSFYSGDDEFYAFSKDSYLHNGVSYKNRSDFSLGWGNATTTLRWNRVITPKLFSNVSFIYSRFRFQTGMLFEDEVKSPGSPANVSSFSLNYLSGIEDFTGKVDFDYNPSPNHHIKFGAGNIYHTFNTGALQYKAKFDGVDPMDTAIGSKTYAHEMSAYIEDDIRIGPRLKANIGLHGAGFFVNNTFYRSLQPRISTRYFITENLAWKSSYAEMMQFIHLLSNAGFGLPTDLWVPATEKVKPQISRQIATGFARTVKLKGEDYEFSVEGYYKHMDNIIDYLPGANFFGQANNWEKQVESGQGWSYGTELFIQKKTGKFTGWIGYTISRTDRQFTQINDGNPFPYKYDRRHDISFVLSYNINEKVDISGTWVYGTGNALTLPIARYNSLPMPGQWGYQWELEHFGDRNSFRMGAYHRMDLGMNFKRKTSWGERIFNISVYNAYNRRNPFFYEMRNDQRGRHVVQYSLFPLIPAISYNFKF
jgi:hypothetical protein